jgi:hypothetical protein
MRFRPRHRAFTLTEILATLALLVFFFDAATQLYRSTILTAASCQQISNESARTDSALYQLRRDVWTAREVNSPRPGMMEITASEDGTITWRFDSDGATRTGGAATERWPDACRNCGVTIGQRWVEISDAGGAVRLTGPILLSKP